MDVIEAIKARKSIRGFKTDPVSKEIIEEILGAAVWAPSAMNSQPWEFFVISGDALEKIREKNIENLRSGIAGNLEHESGLWPKESVFRERQVGLAKQLFSLMDIQRNDMAKRTAWMENGFRFFDAPVAIIITVDRLLTVDGPLLDIGAVMQNICLAAVKHGLGTCIEDQGVVYPQVIRTCANIPDSKRIVLGIALGYPDPEYPANQVQTERVSLETNTTWIGW